VNEELRSEFGNTNSKKNSENKTGKLSRNKTGMKSRKILRKLSERKALVITLIIVLGVFGFIAARWMVMRASAKGSLELRTAFARRGNLSVTVSGSGSAISSSKKDIAAKAGGLLLKTYYKEGDQVNQGDILFELDGSDYQKNLKQAEINLGQARLTYEKTTNEISNLNMVAPFNGQVTGILINEGDTVSANTSILTLIDTSRLKMTLPFGSNTIGKINEGDSATVYLQDFMEYVDGVITYIDEKPYPLSDGSMAYNVEITIKNPGGLNEGVKASAEVGNDKNKVLSLETGAFEYLSKKILKAGTSGTVRKILVRENQFVEAGTLLAVFENDELILNNEANTLKYNDLET